MIPHSQEECSKYFKNMISKKNFYGYCLFICGGLWHTNLCRLFNVKFTAIIIPYKYIKEMVHSFDGDTDFFDSVTEVISALGVKPLELKDRLSIIWKSDLFGKIKWDLFQAVVVSILQRLRNALRKSLIGTTEEYYRKPHTKNQQL